MIIKFYASTTKSSIALYTLSCHSKLLQLSLNLNKPLLLSKQLLPFPPHDLILRQIKRTLFRSPNGSYFELLNEIALYVLCDGFDEFKVDDGGDVVDDSLNDKCRSIEGSGDK
jgi:hypothetical protein